MEPRTSATKRRYGGSSDSPKNGCGRPQRPVCLGAFGQNVPTMGTGIRSNLVNIRSVPADSTGRRNHASQKRLTGFETQCSE